MENWGLVTYRESALLYHPGESSDNDKEWVAIVVSHELAHQVYNLSFLKLQAHQSYLNIIHTENVEI